MKTIATILTALVCSASPLLAEPLLEPKTEQPIKAEERLGQQAVSSLRESFQAGNYAQLLKEIDASYQSARKENRLEGIVEMRDSGALSLNDRATWENLALQLQKEKKEALLQAIPEQESSLFAQKVRSAAATLSTPQIQKSIDQLSLFRLMLPNSGKNSDENRLIDLELEYEYKMIHLGSLSESSNRRELQNVLRMEKMEKMREAARSFQDISLKESIELAAASFDARLAQNWDAADLNALTKMRKPTNALEKKISSILLSYQEKFSDLTQQYFLAREQALDEAQK